MAARKSLRSGRVYIISTDKEDNPKLGAKVLSDGKESLFLEFYYGYGRSKRGGLRIDRKKEFLKLYLYHEARSPFERQQNKETLELAKRIRYERGQEFLEDREGYRLKSESRNINFVGYMWDYYEDYSKKDRGIVKIAISRFTDFLGATSGYRCYRDYIKPSQISREMVLAYTEYLKSRSKGGGASVIYEHFKKIVKNAVEHGVMRNNPCSGIVLRNDKRQLRKEILSQEEIGRLISTECKGIHPDVRRGFIFSLYTGVRFCDVYELRYENVDYGNGVLRFEQRKTRGHSVNSGVEIPLNEGLLDLIGKPVRYRCERIFKLPCFTSCIYWVRKWARCAGIEKHLTWHCARHSFATNILINGANIKTVASLLGHSGLGYVERYTRVVDELKKRAIDSLPELRIERGVEASQD